MEVFNNDQKNTTWPPSNWAFTIFVAYNPPPAPDHFTGDVHFAYVRDYGGPWVQMLYNMGGYGTDRFNEVMTHETGHVFWACDEYYEPGYGGCDRCTNCRNFGPRLAALNRSCAYLPASCQLNQNCQMKNNAATLCPDTRVQIGW